MLAENPKKRKRLVAKDWPPTSTQKKTLLPYTKRIKLPRLDEAPYLAVWMKIVSLALEEKKECCRKMRYFRAVHQELSEVTSSLLSIRPRTGAIRMKRNHYHLGGRISVTSHLSSNPDANMELLWLPSEYTSGTEILVWIYSFYRHITYFSKHHLRRKYCEHVITDLPGCGKLPQPIRRFTDIFRWKSFVYNYLNEENDEAFFNEAWSNKSRRPIIIGKLIRLAPKSLDRLTSKTHICKLIDESQLLDQESSSDDDDYPGVDDDWYDEEFGSCHDIQ